jgi:hypothetical protein
MDSKLQIVAIAGAVALLFIVLEMVRRRRLMERYALLWMLSATIILALSVWQDALNVMARQLGIASGPNALFLVALAFILLLLLHFSAAMSRLSDQSKVLAQRQAILEERLRQYEGQGAEGQRSDREDTEARFGLTAASDAAEDEHPALVRSSGR